MIHFKCFPSFSFLDKLLEILKRFSGHMLFLFNPPPLLHQESNKRQTTAQLGKVSVSSGWVRQEMLSETLNKFANQMELPIYASGPRGFHKSVWETFLKEMGHKQLIIHLKFFDLKETPMVAVVVTLIISGNLCHLPIFEFQQCRCAGLNVHYGIG